MVAKLAPARSTAGGLPHSREFTAISTALDAAQQIRHTKGNGHASFWKGGAPIPGPFWRGTAAVALEANRDAATLPSMYEDGPGEPGVFFCEVRGLWKAPRNRFSPATQASCCVRPWFGFQYVLRIGNHGDTMMVGSDLKKAIARRQALMQEIDKIDNFVSLYREIFGEQLERVPSSEAPSPPSHLVEKHPIRKRKKLGKPGAVSVHDVGPQLRGLLEERGRPMKRGELLDALYDRGLRLAGANPAKYLGTILWRMRDAFVNIEGHGYWPRDLACPEVDYRPDLAVLRLEKRSNFFDDL
jgi:hypothetical protein